MKTILISIIAIILFTSCKKDGDPVYNIPSDAKVIVIGAGAAGLSAGKKLNDNNVDFTILEATDRVGGRLKKNETFTDFPLDMGAEWIHGQKSLTYYLANNLAFEIYEDNSSSGFWYNNQFYTESNPPTNLLPIFTYMASESTGGADISLKDWAIGEGFGPDVYDLLDALAGDLGASASLFSNKQAAIEFNNWSSGDKDYKFKNKTYYDLIHDTYMPQVEDKIVYNAPVTTIDHSGDPIVVTAGGNTYSADRVILTVSVNVLKNGVIEFVPPLSSTKTDAISKIGMEAGMKVYMKFNTAFFENKDMLGTNVGSTYYDVAYGKNSSQPTLGAFVMGEKAKTLSDMGEANAIQAILDELDIIHNGQASSSYTGEYVMQDWYKEPYVLGAYSYSTVGIDNARSILAEPVNNKLFFAGEASNLNGHFQTVQGAIETGEREADNVMTSF